MDFMPLLMLLNNMNNNDKNQNGDLSGIMGQMNGFKEYEQLLKGGNPQNMIMQMLAKNNPNMQGATKMFDMLSSMQKGGGFDFSKFNNDATTESFNTGNEQEPPPAGSKVKNRQGEFLLPISDIANKDITYILNKFFSK